MPLFTPIGIHLWIEPEREAGIREKLLQAGKALGLEEISEEAFHVLRIESGVPWRGSEINDTVIFNELGEENWVSYTKGCFVGQEIVARIKYRAHPPRTLQGFLLSPDRVPASRSSLWLKSKEVGVITSACYSPTLHQVIAMGFLNFGVNEKELTLPTPEGTLQATVTELPFLQDYLE